MSTLCREWKPRMRKLGRGDGIRDLAEKPLKQGLKRNLKGQLRDH